MKANKGHSIAADFCLGTKVKNSAQNWWKRALQKGWTLLDKGLGHQFLLLFLDLLACLAGMLCGWTLGNLWLGIGDPMSRYFPSMTVLCFGIVTCFYALLGYKPTFLRRQERELEIIVKGTTFSFLLIFAFNFLVFKSAGFSRYIYVFSYVLVLSLLLLERFGLKRFYRKLWQRGIGRERALVVGQGLESLNLLKNQFRIQNFSRFELLGYLKMVNNVLTYNSNEEGDQIVNYLDRFLDEQKIGTVFVTLQDYSKDSHRVFLNLITACEKNNCQIFALSKIFSSDLYMYDMDQYVGLLGIRRNVSELEKRLPLFTKRAIDTVGAVCMGALLAPLMMVIAIAVKLQDRGPIFHRRLVVGYHGIPFYALKFRTMVKNADELLEGNQELKAEFENNFKLRDDSRVTCIGKILRKLSLDELPQLYNVLVGQMSLVGPRMVTPEELERYGEFKTERIKIRPGVTGYWQVNGRQEVDYDERIQMDRFYIYRWTIWMDFWILLKTVQKVLRMEGAY